MIRQTLDCKIAFLTNPHFLWPALSEAQEELQAQILTRGVEEGRSLLNVSGPLVANSLAHELSQMSDHEVSSPF